MLIRMVPNQHLTKQLNQYHKYLQPVQLRDEVGVGHGLVPGLLELLEELVRPGIDVLDVGCGSGILSIAASIQLAAVIPNFLIMEHGHEALAHKCRIARSAPQPVDGAFILDDKPGLGVDIDEDTLAAFSTGH